jgi:cyclophilin family peptidyl-prolyl cis-trans isomerase
MLRMLFTVGLGTTLLVSLSALEGQGTKPAPVSTAPVIVLETAKGVLEIETFPEDAPKSVAHFVALVKRGFYRGQRFHWVQPTLVQAGDPYSRDITLQKQWGTGGSGPGRSNKPIGVAEFSKRPFVRGTVALAYRPQWKPETADSMFFILLANNPGLNGKYTVLGHVTKGMNVADKIGMNEVIKNMTVK